jgi:hypothetical protein
MWPSRDPSFTRLDLAWFRRAELYHLKLIEERYREALRADPRRPASLDNEVLDAVFPVLAATGRSAREYEPGPLEPERWAELPPDAFALTCQLVIWFPLDDRLYWLLGEVVNAQEGDPRVASAIFQELLGHRAGQTRRYDPRELRRHAQVLRDAAEHHAAWIEESRRVLELQLNASLGPLKGVLPLGIGPVLEAAAWARAIDEVAHQRAAPQLPSGTPPPAVEEPAKNLGLVSLLVPRSLC